MCDKAGCGPLPGALCAGLSRAHLFILAALPLFFFFFFSLSARRLFFGRQLPARAPHHTPPNAFAPAPLCFCQPSLDARRAMTKQVHTTEITTVFSNFCACVLVARSSSFAIGGVIRASTRKGERCTCSASTRPIATRTSQRFGAHSAEAIGAIAIVVAWFSCAACMRTCWGASPRALCLAMGLLGGLERLSFEMMVL